jgi:hypothetical protein
MGEQITQKIGYKGFDKDLKCRKESFQIGFTYTKNAHLEQPKTCSEDGYHYCDTLEDVFQWYPLGNKNRYCKVEILGSFTTEKDKCVTTSFKILEEVPQETIHIMAMDYHFNLDLLQKIQTKYPEFIIGGSTALYLQGVRLKRWGEKYKKADQLERSYDQLERSYDQESDYDFIVPAFILPESDSTLNLTMEGGADKSYGNDFDYTFYCNGTKIDYRIDPKQRYEYVTHGGYKYKVSPILNIIEAKVRYAMNGQDKHKSDIMEMIKSN